MTDQIFVFQVRLQDTEDMTADHITHLGHNCQRHVNVCKMLVLRPINLTLVGGIGTFDKLQEETRSLCERDRQCDPEEENKN